MYRREDRCGLLLIKSAKRWPDTPHWPLQEYERTEIHLRWELTVTADMIRAQKTGLYDYARYTHRAYDGTVCCEFVAPWCEEPVTCPNCGERFVARPAELTEVA